MNTKPSYLALLTLSYLSTLSFTSSAVEIRGNVGVEARYFPSTALDPEQTDQQVALTAETEFYWDVGDNGNSFTFKPFVRLDSQDKERHQFDVREFNYLHVGEDWELRAGISKVYWGVTETLHLVDIINQTDTLQSFDGEDKFGQPMINLSLIKDWGTIDAFILPGFRERKFSDKEGRIRSFIAIDDKALYESSAEQKHIDLAARWSHSIDDWDIGLSWFKGTSREPGFVMNQQGDKLQAYYPQISQYATDIQYIYESWLWKLEAITRQGDKINNYSAFVGGFEYSLIGIFDSIYDLGIVAEYAFDDRKNALVNSNQNDLAIAGRWALNDAESTEVLAGIRQDLDYEYSRTFFVEASTRIGDSCKVSLDAWFFSATDKQELSYSVRRDDFIQLDFSYYF